MQRVNNGFSLVELMIVVAIVGILSAIVVPTYQDYVRRSSLQDGLASLSDLRIKLEQFYQSNRNYGDASAATPCGFDGTTNQVPFTSTENFAYTCALSGGGNQGYLITATGSGAAGGHVYTLDHNNARATTTFKGASVTKSCWLMKGQEC